MSSFMGMPIIQCDGGAGQEESSSDNETSETSVDSSDEDEDTSDEEDDDDDEAKNVNESEKKRRTRSTRSTADSSTEKPKGRLTRQKTKEQTNVPTKRLLRSRKKSPVAGSGSKQQPQVFSCPDCKKTFNSKVSVSKHRQWCKPKSTKASPKKKSETSKVSNKQDKPKQEEQQQQQQQPTVTPDKPRARGRPRKSLSVPTPTPPPQQPATKVEEPQQPPVVEHHVLQSEVIEDDFMNHRSPDSSPGIPDTSSESDYERREFVANFSNNVTIDVVNPDPPVDPTSQGFISDQTGSLNGPVQCSICKMTYRTAQGYQKHLPSCIPYSSSDDEDEDVDVQGFSENNELTGADDQLSIRETTTGFMNSPTENQVNLQTGNDTNDASSEESSSSSAEDSEPMKNEVTVNVPYEQNTNSETQKVPNEDSIPNEIEESDSSQHLPSQNEEAEKPVITFEFIEPGAETTVSVNSFNVGVTKHLESQINANEIQLTKIVNIQLPQQQHQLQAAPQPSPVKSTIVLQENRMNVTHDSVAPSIPNNLQNIHVPLPPPTQQQPLPDPVSQTNIAQFQQQQQQYNTFSPARTQAQQFNHPVMLSAATSGGPSAGAVSAPHQYFQHTHQNTPTYTQAQLMPGTVVNSVMQMQQMSTSFHNQDPSSSGYISSQNVIRTTPNCVPNVTSSASLPSSVQPNTALGNNTSQEHQSHLFRNNIDHRIPTSAQHLQAPPQQQFPQFAHQLHPGFQNHFPGQAGQPGHPFAQQQQFLYNGGSVVPYGSNNGMQFPGLQQQQLNGLQFQPNQIPQSSDPTMTRQLQSHIVTNQQGLSTLQIQPNGSIPGEGARHPNQMPVNINHIPTSHHHQQSPQSQPQFFQIQNQMQKLNGGNMLMQNVFNGQNIFSVGGNNANNNPQPHQAVPYQLQQNVQSSQILQQQPFVHQGQQQPSVMHNLSHSQQDPNLGPRCGPNPAQPMQNGFGSMLQNNNTIQSIQTNQEFQQPPTQIHQQMYRGGHILPVMQQQQSQNAQIQLQQQQELQRNLQQQHVQQSSQAAVMGQWNKSDVSNSLQGQISVQAAHQQPSSLGAPVVPQLPTSNHNGEPQSQVEASNPTPMTEQQQQLQPSNNNAPQQAPTHNALVVAEQQQQQHTQQQSAVTTPFIQQIAQLADGSTVILLTPTQPQNTNPGVLAQNGIVSNNNSFQQTANMLNLLPGLQNISCQQQQQHSPQLSPQIVQCSLTTTNAVNGTVPHVGSVGRSAPCPCPACKEKIGTANALDKYKKVLPYPSDQGKQRQGTASLRPIMIRPGPGKPQQRTIRIQKAVIQSPNGNAMPAQQQQQQNLALPPVRLVPLVPKAGPQGVGVGVVVESPENTTNTTSANRVPISNQNIAVVRPMENPLQKLSDQISQIESTFMSPQPPTTPSLIPPRGPHLTLVTISPPPPLTHSPAQSPQIVASNDQVFGVTTTIGSPIQQQTLPQLLDISKSFQNITMDLNEIPQPRLTLVDHGISPSNNNTSLPSSPSKTTAVVRNGTVAGVKRKAAPTESDSGPNKSIKVTLRRKEGGDSYSINRITGTASGKGTMKSLKIKGQIKSGEHAGTLTDVVVVPVIHTVPIPDPDGDETDSNRTIAEDGGNCSTNGGGTPMIPTSSIVELPATSTEESSGESLRLTHRAVIVYEVQCNDTVLFRSSDVRAVWGYIFETVQGTRLNHNLPPLSYPATNISLPNNEQEGDASFNKTGLTHRAVQFLLEQLPGMKALASDFKFVKPVSPNQLNEEPVQENESGCARTEIFTGRKPFDMFGWLASKHRKAPDSIVCNMSLESAKNLAAPLSMRYRKLKEKVDKSLVVWWSIVHGRGLYTKRDIEKGEMIIEYAGEVIRPHVCDIREKYYESKSIGCYMFRVNDQVIDATMKGNAARFINHSCEPNCEAKAVKISGKDHILIFALRRIFRGEELTYDYKFEKEEDKIPCTCASKNCRKYLN